MPLSSSSSMMIPRSPSSSSLISNKKVIPASSSPKVSKPPPGLHLDRSPWRRFFQKPAQRLGRDTFGPTSRRRFLLHHVARRDQQFETSPVFAREPFNDRIRRLSRARIENLNFARIGTDA